MVASVSAFATDNNHKKSVPSSDPTYFLQGQNQELYNNPINTLSAASTATSNSNSSSSTNASVNSDNGNTYFFPSPATAAPLPPGLCPKGDSESFSIVWGFVSFAKSSTRTEMECLDKVLATLKPEVKIVEKIVPVEKVVEKTVYVEQKCPAPVPTKKKTVAKAAPAKVCK